MTEQTHDAGEVLVWLRRPVILMLLLAAVAFVTYRGTLSYGFVWDDHALLVENSALRSWRMLPHVFSSDLWAIHTTAVHQAYYRPMAVAVGIASYALFGLKAWWWHLLAVLMHATASCLVLVIARRLRLEYWTAAAAALLFAVHPVHVEPAVWVGASGEEMMAIFYLLALLAYLISRQRPAGARAGWILASLVLLVVALFTKEMVVTFALVVLLHEWLFIQREKALRVRLLHSVAVAAPYAVLTAAYLLVRQAAMHRFASFVQPPNHLSVVLTEPGVLLRYLRLLVFPVGLNPLYYTPYVERLNAATIAAALLLLAIVAALFVWARRSQDPVVAFAAVWMPLTLAPVLYLPAFAAGDFIRDRYLYLPSVGFCILLAKMVESIPSWRGNGALLRGATVAVLALAGITGCLLQQVYWASDILLFYRGASLNPHSVYAATSLGQALEREGHYARAAAVLEDVVRAEPGAGSAYYVLASAYARLGRGEDARRALAEAVRLFPAYAADEAGMNDVASIYGSLGEYDRALQLYASVLQRQPDYYLPLYNSGYTCFRMGRYAEAERFLRHAVEVAPELSPPNYYLGRVLLAQQRPEAEQYLRRALQITPSGHEFHYWLGQALERRGDLPMAQQEYREELRLRPENANARERLNALTR